MTLAKPALARARQGSGRSNPASAQAGSSAVRRVLSSMRRSTIAAYKVTEVSVVRWRPEARRQSPVADAASLTAVCEAVLRAAGASLPVSDLADVVAASELPVPATSAVSCFFAALIF